MKPYVYGIALSVGLSSLACADIIGFSGAVGASTEMTGATYSGTMDYQFTGDDMGTLFLTIANDTPEDVGGFLTGVVFNVNSNDDEAAAQLVLASDPDFLDTDEEAAPPFGTFDAGVALGANWSGGANPALGLGVGAEGVFEFKVTASDASSLMAIDFLGGSLDEIGMVVRFRGLNDGGSDKVPNVPAPGAAGLLALGGLFAARRRR